MTPERPRILAVGTAAPPRRYTQAEVLDHMGVTDPRIRRLFDSSHINTRHLYLPPQGKVEDQRALLDKHLAGVVEIAPQAIEAALDGAGLSRCDIDYLCCVTTTGYLTPGVSAHLARSLGLRGNLQRADIVGMGCNAGLNGLSPAAHWAMANPGRNALLVCVEICSAAYVVDGSLRTAVVNSLFGDGAAAAVVRAQPQDARGFAAQVLGFESALIVEHLDAMRYDWEQAEAKFSFFLDRDIPYVIGSHVEAPVTRLLDRFGLERRDVRHWIVHSGGKKVVDAIQYNIGLTTHDVRHTVSVLRDYGNVSSASFLFSYERLLQEGSARRGDHAVMITMGPGTTIETALLRF